MKMKVTIDRFEGNYAVCEKADRTVINIPKNKIPPDAKEGDILILDGDSLKIDNTDTARRKQSIDQIMKDLWT